LLQIPPQGEMNVFEVPHQAAMPSDVAIGRDGSVWFIESRENRIARFKNGRFEEFNVAGPSPVLSGLAVTADGDLWFGLLPAGAVARRPYRHVQTTARGGPACQSCDRRRWQRLVRRHHRLCGQLAGA